jgi:hypothetical protein
MWNQVQRGGVRSAIHGLDANRNILRGTLGVFDKHVEIAVLFEDACVQQFELEASATTIPVLRNQALVGEPCLGVLIEVFHVGMSWGIVEVEVVFLHILAMISFARRKAKGALFQNRILAIPDSQAEDKQLISVAYCCQAIFTPAVSLAAGRVVGKKIPSRSVGTVVFSNGAPGTLADVGPPAAPKELSACLR